MSRIKQSSVLGERLERILEEKNITKTKLQEETGVHYNTILRIIKEGITSTDTLLSIARTLDTSCSYLLGETDYDGNISDYLSGLSCESIVYIPILNRDTLKYTSSYPVYSKYIYRFIDTYGSKLKCIQYIGNTMSPIYSHEDILLFVDDNMFVGYNVVLKYYDKVLIRECKKDNNGYVFYSYNKEYSNIICDKFSDDIKIIGRVVGVIPAVKYDE